MKRIRNIAIGGIQTKIFNLILTTVLLMALISGIVFIYHSRMLSELATESGQKQTQAFGDTTASVMDEVITTTMGRSNRAEAQLVDDMFKEAANRVSFLADYAEEILTHPDKYSPKPYEGPNPEDDGYWTAKVIYADGVNADDPAVASRVGLLANLSEVMISLCPSTGAANAYIAIPEGVHLSVSDNSSSWFENGQVSSYDPRTRTWYQQAVEEGGLTFTDGGWDANTGAYCVECAKPVYGPDGSLEAVVGTDVYLYRIQQVLQDSATEGGYQLFVNGKGRAVLGPQAQLFPMVLSDRMADLRESRNKLIAQVVSEALAGHDTGVLTGDLYNGSYYIAASPIETTGWVLVSAYSKEIVNRPAVLLKEKNSEIQAEAAQIYREKTGKSRLTAVILLLLTVAAMLAGALILGKRIVKPLNTITERISELREGNMEFKMDDAYRTGDEVEELAQSFATISHKTVQYVETVKQVTAEKERIGAELALANQIQAAMLPHIVPAFPDRTDFDIIGSMKPAKEVGGDFYDYFLIDDDHLCMVMADVSGKGVPAALFMMASKIILQSVAKLGASPAQALAKTNEAICSNNEAEMFVTVWLGILELSTGKLTAANAGHEYPVFKMPGEPFKMYKDKHGFVIGGMEGVSYTEYEVFLKPGSKIFVYTDGVPEATDENQVLFGTERMIEALNAKPDLAPAETLDNIHEAVDAFVGDAEQFDDLTMMCLEYKGK